MLNSFPTAFCVNHKSSLLPFSHLQSINYLKYVKTFLSISFIYKDFKVFHKFLSYVVFFILIIFYHFLLICLFLYIYHTMNKLYKCYYHSTLHYIKHHNIKRELIWKYYLYLMVCLLS